jgi:peptide/nickel transport system substrate-binding protein
MFLNFAPRGPRNRWDLPETLISKASGSFLKKRSAYVALLLLTAAAQPPGNCGTVVVPADNDFTSFSPLLGDSLGNAQAAQAMYLNLIWIGGGARIEWPRSLASAVTTPDSGKTYIVTMRPWHWSDGVPVTAADAVYDVKLIQQLGQGYVDYGEGGMPNLIKSISVIDATHFQVVLTRQVNPTWFIYNGLAQIVPLPAHAWAHVTLDEMAQLQSTPSFFKVVDGPLKLAEFATNRYAAYVPNPAYDGPPMHFDRLVFAFIESDGAAIEQVESGDVDLAPLPTEFWTEAQHLPNAHVVTLVQQPTWNYIALNFRNKDVEFLNDVRVRDAIADAQNQTEIIDLALHGQGYAVYAPVNEADASFEAPAILQGHFPVGYNPAKARALLAAAGYTPGPDGIMQKDGKRLSFTALSPTGSTESDEVDEVTQENLRAVGIELKIREIQFNQMLALMSGPPQAWQAAMIGQFFSGYPSGESMFQTGAAQNNGFYSDPTMDRLIDASINKPGLDALYAYELYASAQQPVIFTASPSQILLANNRLQGVNGFYDPGGLAFDMLFCRDGGH